MWCALRQCIFCGLPFGRDRPDSREHVWSEWMRDLLPKRPGAQLISRVGADEQHELLERREYGGVLQRKLKPRVVCRECNTGWMSVLEETTKPILLPLILKEPCELTIEDQKTLATWMCLKNMVAELSHPQTRATKPADYQRMYDLRLPPSGATVWLGAHTGEDWSMRYRHHGMRVAHSSIPAMGGEDDPPMNGQIATFTAGPVVFVLLTLPDGFLYGAPIPNGRIATRVRQIYPTQSPFTWPPVQSLNNDDVLFLGDGMVNMFRRLVTDAER